MTGSGSGHPHLFEPLGQPDHRDVGDAEPFEHRAGRVDLRRAAVDDVQVRRVGKAAGLPFRRKHIQVVLLAEVAREAAPGHLGDGGDIVGAPCPAASRMLKCR